MSAAQLGLAGISHRLQKNGAMRMHRKLCASITHRGSQTWRWGFAAALALLIGASMPVHAQSETAAAAPALKEKCLGCHDDAEMKSEDGKPMAVMADDYHRSAHRKLDCIDCHDAALSTRHPKNELGPVKPQVCQDCHEDEFKAIAGSIHGRRASGDRAIKDCNACHGSLHTVHKSGDPASPLSPVNQIKTCGTCHDDILVDYETSEHARALIKSGLVGSAPSCSSCHGKHEIHPKSEAGATTSHARIPETCGNCHKGIVTDWMESAHGTALAAGDKGPVCSTCHSPHAVKQPTTAAVRHQISDGCGNCHEAVSASFKDSFHGKATELNNAKVASCASCHTPHANYPAADPRSSVHKDNLAATCGVCHQDVNASFLSFDPHANPKDPTRNAYVYWIWLSMTSAA